MSSTRPWVAGVLAVLTAVAVAAWLLFASGRTAFGESIQGDWTCTRSDAGSSFLMQVAANTVVLRDPEGRRDRYGTWFIDHNVLTIRGIFDTDVRVAVPDSLPETLRGDATVPEQQHRHAFDLSVTDGGDHVVLVFGAQTTLECLRR